MNGRIRVTWQHSGKWPNERWLALITPVRPRKPDPNNPFDNILILLPLWSCPLGSWEALPDLIAESQWRMLIPHLWAWYRAVFVDRLPLEGEARPCL